MNERRKLWQWCPIQQKVVPKEEVLVPVPANISHNVISDEMPPTRNPLNPSEVYTSKSKLRAAYKAAGAVEVGNEFENGYDPDKERHRNFERMLNRTLEQFRDRIRSK